MRHTTLAMVLVLVGVPAVASAGEYQVEARVLNNAGELLGEPSLKPVAHEPATVDLAAGNGRVLHFWVLVKPMKDRECDKVMIRVDLRKPSTTRGQPGMAWTTAYWETCDDKVKSLEKSGFVMTVRVRRDAEGKGQGQGVAGN